jgi:hypothetical protein
VKRSGTEPTVTSPIDCLVSRIYNYEPDTLNRKIIKQANIIVPRKNIIVNAFDSCIDSIRPAGKKTAKKLKIPSIIILNLHIDYSANASLRGNKIVG